MMIWGGGVNFLESQVDSVHDAILGPEVQLDGEGAGRPPRQEHSDPRVRALQQGEGSLFRGLQSQKKNCGNFRQCHPLAMQI